MTSMAPPQEPAWQKDISVTLKCPECEIEPPNVVEKFSEGTLVCADCGLVLENGIIDTRSEWRTFSNDDQNNDDPSRVGQGENPLLNGNQLTTDIAFTGGAASRDLNRAQTKATQDKGSKALLAAYKDIGELCDGWQLSKQVIDTAKALYKKTVESGNLRGKSQEVIIAGCIFISCRICGVPRTFREVFALTKVPKKEIGKVFKQLEALLKKDDEDKENELKANGIIVNASSVNASVPSKTVNASALLIRYSSQLGLDPVTHRVAEQVAQRMDDKAILAGRSPLSQCAASLYFASHLMGQEKSSAEISKVLGISDGTIRTVYKVLFNVKDQLIDPKWLKPVGRGDVAKLPVV